MNDFLYIVVWYLIGILVVVLIMGKSSNSSVRVFYRDVESLLCDYVYNSNKIWPFLWEHVTCNIRLHIIEIINSNLILSINALSIGDLSLSNNFHYVTLEIILGIKILSEDDLKFFLLNIVWKFLIRCKVSLKFDLFFVIYFCSSLSARTNKQTLKY